MMNRWIEDTEATLYIAAPVLKDIIRVPRVGWNTLTV